MHLKFHQTGVQTNDLQSMIILVLGECGRERLYVTCIIKCVKYLVKNYYITC